MINLSHHITAQTTIKPSTEIEGNSCCLQHPPCSVLLTSLLRTSAIGFYVLTFPRTNVLTLSHQYSVVHYVEISWSRYAISKLNMKSYRTHNLSLFLNYTIRASAIRIYDGESSHRSILIYQTLRTIETFGFVCPQYAQLATCACVHNYTCRNKVTPVGCCGTSSDCYFKCYEVAVSWFLVSHGTVEIAVACNYTKFAPCLLLNLQLRYDLLFYKIHVGEIRNCCKV
jgi:hypothetical protein